MLYHGGLPEDPMANRPDDSESLMAPPPLAMPVWAANMRVTKEQLAAAERTREYHVRKLQSRIMERASSSESSARSEH